MIWTLDAALPRIAEKAALRMWLPRTITLPARKTLMALPFCPLPPERAAVSSMRLSAIRPPSARLSLCQRRMPPLPDLAMLLAAMRRPRLSLQKSALSAAPVMVECVTSPSQPSRVMPLPQAPATLQSAMRTALTSLKCTKARPAGSVRPPPSSARPVSETVSACSDEKSEGPCVRINRLAPRTPARLAPAGSVRRPVR